MENRSNDLLVGSFVLIFVIAALGFVAWLTGRDVGGEAQTYEIYLRRSVTGLQTGSPVRYLGVPVGTVTDIRIDPETMNRVRVRIEVPQDTPIRTDSEARLEQQGLTGGVFVQISPGSDDAGLLYQVSNEDIPEIRSAPSQFGELLEAAPRLLENLINLSERATEVFSDDNIQALGSSMDELQKLSAELTKASARLVPLLDNADKTLTTYDQLGKNVDSRMTAFLDQTSGTVKTIEKATVDVYAEMTKTSQSIYQTSEAAQKMVNTANKIVDANSGAIGDFTSSGLYELTYLFQELRGLISNLNLLAERLERGPTEFLFGGTANGVQVEE